MERIILRACPFCARHGKWSCVPQDDGIVLWSFGCTNKRCEVQPKTDYHESQKEVAFVWNRRPEQPKEIWAMEFVFSEEKANTLGYTAQACYDVVDKIFAKYGIKPEEQGVYVALESQNTFDAFGAAMHLTSSDWFLKVIDTWLTWEGDDEAIDCLKIHYEIEKRNKL